MMKYVRGIDYIPAIFLKYCTVDRYLQSILIDDSVPWSDLQIRRDRNAAVEVQESAKNGVTMFSTKVEAALSCGDLLPEGPVAFRLRMLDGSSFVVGVGERPFPVFRWRRIFPEKFSEAPVWRLTVEWNSLLPPLLIV